MSWLTIWKRGEGGGKGCEDKWTKDRLHEDNDLDLRGQELCLNFVCEGWGIRECECQPRRGIAALVECVIVVLVNVFEKAGLDVMCTGNELLR